MGYLKKWEFESPDIPGSGSFMDEDFMYKLNQARVLAGVPFSINSGYRTKKHNKKVGGVADSSHLIGVAADIACSNSRHRSIIVGALLSVGFTRLGIANSFIHVDSDKNKSPDVIWTY